MKRRIRLTESDLHRIVNRSLKRVLKETEDKSLYRKEKWEKMREDFARLRDDLNSVVEEIYELTDEYFDCSSSSSKDLPQSLINVCQDLYSAEDNLKDYLYYELDPTAPITGKQGYFRDI